MRWWEGAPPPAILPPALHFRNVRNRNMEWLIYDHTLCDQIEGRNPNHVTLSLEPLHCAVLFLYTKLHLSKTQNSCYIQIKSSHATEKSQICILLGLVFQFCTLKPNILSTVTGNCPTFLDYLMSILKYVSPKHIQLCFNQHLLFCCFYMPYEILSFPIWSN